MADLGCQAEILQNRRAHNPTSSPVSRRCCAEWYAWHTTPHCSNRVSARRLTKLSPDSTQRQQCDGVPPTDGYKVHRLCKSLSNPAYLELLREPTCTTRGERIHTVSPKLNGVNFTTKRLCSGIFLVKYIRKHPSQQSSTF